MGVLDEDEEILISRFIQLLAAEGFVKPIIGKSLEEAAKEYVEELVDRNMVILVKRMRSGNQKTFKIHDLLRDVCVREGRKLKFLSVLEKQSIPQSINSQRRRTVGRLKEDEYPTPLLQSLESASHLRSFLMKCPRSLSSKFRLSRVLMFAECFEEEDRYGEIFLGLVNLRFLVVIVDKHLLPRIPSSLCFYWNLHTIYLSNIGEDYVFEIWKVPQLRHVITDYDGTLDGAYCLPNTFSDEDDLVLGHLKTLYHVKNLKFGEEVVKRIPNIKKLKLYYKIHTREVDYYCLNDLCCLHKLEFLCLCWWRGDKYVLKEVSFPHSLKKLTLRDTFLDWEVMKTKIGWLPHLQVLKLQSWSFSGSEWETLEDQFLNLKFLLVEECDIEVWITDTTHFPRLEHLHLCGLHRLREIPSCMGDIPTLHSIRVDFCSDSVADSVETIKEEQQELGNQDLQITIRHIRNY